MIPEPFVTANEVAEHLKITRRQVLEMSRKKFIPAHPICFGTRRKIWRFKLSEVDEAIASGVHKPASSVHESRKVTSNTISAGNPQ
jgi:excisionase family DNA binding protein